MSLVAAVLVAWLVHRVVGAVLGASLSRPSGRRRPSISRRRWAQSVTPFVVLVSFGLAALAFVVVNAVSGTPRMALVPAVLTGLLPSWQSVRRRQRQRVELQAAWPDAIRHVLAGVRSGQTVQRAVESLATDGPPILAPRFRRFGSLAAAFGMRGALETIRDEIADPTTDRVVEILAVADEAGSMLSTRILEDLAAATASDLRALEEIRTEALELELNARIVFVVPWLVIVVLTAADESYRQFYATQPAGLGVLVAGIALSAVGAIAVVRLGRSEVEPRVFTGTVE